MEERRNIIGVGEAVRPGYVRNPATGKEVLATGRVGRAVIAAHEARLRATGAAIPRGTVGNVRGRAAAPAGIVVDYATMGPPKATGAFRLQNFARRGGAAVTVASMARDIAATYATIPNPRQVNVSFIDPQGYLIWRTIHGRTAGDFLNAIDGLQTKGAAAGSDEVGTSFTLDTSAFQVGSVTFPAGAAGKFTGVSCLAGRKHPHFQLIDFAGKAAQGDCLIAVLRAVARQQGLEVTRAQNRTIRTRLGIPPGAIAATPENIRNLAVEFGVNVRIITGMAAKPDAEREYDDCRARVEGRNICVNAEATPVVIAEHVHREGAPVCDIYLAEDHYEYISRYLEVCLCQITGDIISNPDKRSAAEISRRVASQGRNYYGVRPEAPAAKVTKNRVIVYDYETTYTHDGTIEPYALGFVDFDPGELCEDFSGHEGRVTQVVRREGESRFSVTAPLLDLLAAAPDDVGYTLVSFNGARFDHYILAEASQNRSVLSGVFATPGAGLRSLTLGRHNTLDLAKICPAMSLESACAGFDTKPTKMSGFDHTDVQKQANAGQLYAWLAEQRGQLAAYLARDVLSTASLFAKVSAALTQLSGEPIYGRKLVGTIGGHAWKMMNRACPLPARVSTHELDKTIRSAIVGGRVQCYDETKKTHEFKEAHMVDFASLYPTAMAAVPKAASVFDDWEKWGWYPAGVANSEPRAVGTWTPGEVGIYRVTVHEQPPGLPNVLPRRLEGEPLEWSYRGEFDTWATHIDLALIEKGRGHVSVHEGYTWPVCRPALFEPFIRGLAAGKDEQDVYAKTGDARYNPALRMMYKIIMNSASGKCCQNNYDDSVELATGTAAQLAAERKLDQDRPITWIPLGAETCIIMGKKVTEQIYRKTAKPSILAVLIYAYSRALVWRTLCQHRIVYGDTDSGLFGHEDYLALRSAFPQMDPTGRRKELGDLEEELAPHARAKAFTLAPKDYAVFLYNEDGKIDAKGSKLRVKGVNQRRDRLISPNALEELSALTIAEYTDEYASAQTDRSRPLKDAETLYEFYDTRAAGAEVHVLTSQMVRSYKNAAHPFELAQRFMIKRL